MNNDDIERVANQGVTELLLSIILGEIACGVSNGDAWLRNIRTATLPSVARSSADAIADGVEEELAAAVSKAMQDKVNTIVDLAREYFHKDPPKQPQLR